MPASSDIRTDDRLRRRYVIVGAGQAGRRAAETLVDKAPEARITLLGDEPHAPYDRPALSKAALLDESGEAQIFLRDAAYYANSGIETHFGTRVDRIEREAKQLTLSDGTHVRYDRLLLATGSHARRLDTDASVHYLRTLADARALRGALRPGARVAIIGAGFIGLEVAATAVQRGCQVVVIEPAQQLMQRSLPAVVADHMLKLHTARGVRIELNTRILEMHREKNGTVRIQTGIGLATDERTADLVVAGIGAIPNVELARQAGLDVNDGIVVDAQCRTNDPNIFAAGEVTSHFNPLLGRHVRVESWQVAENQPAVAAENMLGGSRDYKELPWLWSDQYDCNVQTLGFLDERQSPLMRGSPASGAFCLFGLDETGRLNAAVTVNSGRDMAACKRLALQKGLYPALDPAQLTDLSVPLRSLIR